MIYDTIYELRIITLLSEADIIAFVEAHPISYGDYKNFWLCYGKNPTLMECQIIAVFGFEAFKNLIERT